MIKLVCPVCRKPIEVAAVRDLPTFPVCSERCRLMDLGRWLDERYRVPGEGSPEAEPPDASPGEERP